MLTKIVEKTTLRASHALYSMCYDPLNGKQTREKKRKIE
jgi:hypothetical protein